MLDETCHRCFWSDTSEGKAPETSLADLTGSPLPVGSDRDQETGFQGLTRAGITIVQPKQTPRGGERTPLEQAANRAIAAISIRIEQASSGGKRYRLVQDKIRLLTEGIRDPILETCGGLHNVRRQYRPWHYAT